MRRRGSDGGEHTDHTVREGVGIGTLVLIGIAVLFVVISFLTGFKKTPKDQVGLSYGGGPFEGAHFQGIHQPGSGLFFNGLRDKLYLYPVTQRNYIISKNPEEGDRENPDSITAPGKDGVPVDFEVATYFKLNPAKFQKFHEQIGLKYAAWTDEGWRRMLEESFRQQIESAIQQEARKYDAVDIFRSQAILLNIQREVGEVLKERISSVLGDEYFCGPTVDPEGKSCPDFTFVVKKAGLPDNVVKALEDNRTSEIQVKTKLNEVQQKEAEAKAIDALNAAFARNGNSYLYVLLQAIQSGKIDFWVLPDNANGLTLQAPSRAP